MIIQGVYTALITPWQDEQIDLAALAKLVQNQLEANIDGLVVAGSTGEGISLSIAEKIKLLKYVLDLTKSQKHTKIIATITAASTNQALEQVEAYNLLPISAIMLTLPHYIRPSQADLVNYLTQISQASKRPIILYPNPSRTSGHLEYETLLQLRSLSNIVAIKDGANDLLSPLRYRANFSHNFNFLAADDTMLLPYVACGGKGVVSVTSNILPKLMQRLCYLAINGPWQYNDQLDILGSAQNLQAALLPFFNKIFSVTNPVGIKSAASIMGLCNNQLRSPLLPAEPEVGKSIATTLAPLIKLEEQL